MKNTTRHRSRAALAGAAASAMLLGSTFALWTAQDENAGGSITNGNLEVVALQAGDMAAYDVSADRSDATGSNPVTGLDAHVISDLDAWSFVPGDSVQVNLPYEVALDGDNLVANLQAAIGTAANDDVSFSYQVFTTDDDGVTWDSASSVVAGVEGAGVDLGHVQAGNQASGTLDPAIPVIDKAVADGDANVMLVVTATFDAASTDSASMLGVNDFEGASLTATQVRTSGVGHFN